VLDGIVDGVLDLPVGTVSTTTGGCVEESAGESDEVSDEVEGAAITLALPTKSPNPTDKPIALRASNLNGCSDIKTILNVRGCLKSRTGCKKALSVYAVNR
jgi:hypothetical protein